MKYTHIRQQTQIKKYNLGGLFSQFGQMMQQMGGDGKFGQFINNIGGSASQWGDKINQFQNTPQMSESAMGQWGQVAGAVEGMMGMGNQLASDLMTAKTQDENTTWKDTTKGAIKDVASGNWTSAVGNMANKALDTVEDKLMGDKNFNQNSEAVDNATRALSKKAMKFGPWGLLAAGILESANFIDKAAGKTVQGFEVGEVGSGFNGIETDQESASYRGSQARRMKQELAKRAESVNMALTANRINEDEQFQATARMNSIDNVLNANRMALAGGIDTSLLGG